MARQSSRRSTDSSLHSLLDPPLPAYTEATVRRALAVWMHCGQQNEFRQVCNYYHRLEAMEQQLPVEIRVSSRVQEFNLLTSHPPSSQFLTMHYPGLYSQNKNNKTNVKDLQQIAYEDCIFKLEGFNNLKIRKGTTTKDIVRVNYTIRKFCNNYSKSLRGLLSEFQNFTKITKTANCVENIAMYVKRIYLKDDLVGWFNLKNILQNTLSFLDEPENTNKVKNANASITEGLGDAPSPIVTNIEVLSKDQSPYNKEEDHTFNDDRNANQIKILINESRRQELLNMIPNCQIVLTAKLSKFKKPKPGKQP